MDYRSIFQIAAAGMGLERLRVDVAALNLANVHSSQPAGQAGYAPRRVLAPVTLPGFAAALQGPFTAGAASQGVQVVELPTPPRLVHDPGHPHANAQGWVAYPAVDQASEMVTLSTALRTYEAHVAVAATARAMATKALDIGGQG